MPPVSGVPKNVAGRPDWGSVRRSPTRAFRLIRRVCDLIGEAEGFKMCREWAGCSLGLQGVAFVQWIEPLTIPDERTVERAVLAARFARDLAKRPTVAEAEVLARRHDLKAGDVVADAELWSGEPLHRTRPRRPRGDPGGETGQGRTTQGRRRRPRAAGQGRGPPRGGGDITS